VTRSSVRTLDDSERVVELARMLAGTEETETGRAHAEELLAAAAEDKRGSPPPTPISKGVTQVSRRGGRRSGRRAG
jgi:DNA repair protein RecN (Recombination protein N)